MNRRLYRSLGLALFAALLGAGSASATTYYIAANGSDSNNGTSKSSPWLCACRAIALLLFVFATGRVTLAQMPASCVVGTNVYYIDNGSGVDSHSQSQAKTKSTPWAHAPYQLTFTGSYSHTPGDCFIFKGGDTWLNADSFSFTNGGNSGVQDYYGVDTSWFNGGSFARPIMDIQSKATPAKNFNFNAGYITVDNWEVKNASCNSSSTQIIFSPNANHGIYVTNNYVHAFQPPSAGCSSNEILVQQSGGTPPCDGLFDHNVVNGADGNTGYYTESNHGNDCSPITNNVFHDLCSAVNNYTHLVAYNLIYNVGGWSGAAHNCSATGGFHPDGIQTDSDTDIHDNVIYNVVGEWIQLSPHGSSAWPVSHVYNNVEFQTPADTNIAPPDIQLGTGGDNFSPNGVVYIFNNTMQCGNDGCVFFEQTNLQSVTIQNNHQINPSGTASICINNPPFNNAACTKATASFTYNASSELYQTEAAAAAAGYTQTAPYYYSPQTASSPTVGIGVNNSFECGTGMLLCTDTEYGVVVNTGNIAIAGRTPNNRPAGGAWDAGAYAFNSNASDPPAAPSGLIATVQ